MTRTSGCTLEGRSMPSSPQSCATAVPSVSPTSSPTVAACPCTDTDNGAVGTNGQGCAAFRQNDACCPANRAEGSGMDASCYDDADFVAGEMCCACGGGHKPTTFSDASRTCGADECVDETWSAVPGEVTRGPWPRVGAEHRFDDTGPVECEDTDGEARGWRGDHDSTGCCELYSNPEAGMYWRPHDGNCNCGSNGCFRPMTTREAANNKQGQRRGKGSNKG